MKKTGILLLLIFLSFKNEAQTKNSAEDKLGTWYMYNGSHTLSDKFNLKSMAHFRFFDLGNDMQQFIGRIGGNYKFNKTISATLGYVFLNNDETFKIDDSSVNEHRVYEDLNIKQRINKLGLVHRFRAEQRFFNSTTGHFIRYQLGLNYPISENWSTYIYDEIFFDFNGESFNQNWLGIGFSYKASKSTKLKFGYQNISINDGPQFDRILVGIVLTTDHRKKK